MTAAKFRPRTIEGFVGGLIIAVAAIPAFIVGWVARSSARSEQ